MMMMIRRRRNEGEGERWRRRTSSASRIEAAKNKILLQNHKTKLLIFTHSFSHIIKTQKNDEKCSYSVVTLSKYHPSGWKLVQVIFWVSLAELPDVSGLGSFWVLDPIDGTKGFLRKEQYAICLCMVKDGTIMASALGCPNLPVPSPLAGLLTWGVAEIGGRCNYFRSLDLKSALSGATSIEGWF